MGGSDGCTRADLSFVAIKYAGQEKKSKLSRHMNVAMLFSDYIDIVLIHIYDRC